MASPIVKDLGIQRKTANRITKNRHIHTDTRMISTSKCNKKKQIKKKLKQCSVEWKA